MSKISEKVEQTIAEVGSILGERRSADNRGTEDAAGEIPWAKGKAAKVGVGAGTEMVATIRMEHVTRMARLSEAEGSGLSGIQDDLDDLAATITNVQATLREMVSGGSKGSKELAHKIANVLAQANMAIKSANNLAANAHESVMLVTGINLEGMDRLTTPIGEAEVPSAQELKSELDDLAGAIEALQKNLQGLASTGSDNLKDLAKRLAHSLTQADSAVKSASNLAAHAHVTERRSSDNRGAEDAGIGEIPGPNGVVNQGIGTEKMGHIAP